MERLQKSDPARVGGHRLLGRLGAGGMGVVYLGRTEDGALAAVKVIRAEYAGESDFRARFRREAEIAARVDSPWAVRITGSDPDAAEPWLATAFVPGPSLAEAVSAHGPLPLRSVRVLGAALAKALTVMHEQGLVHRDLKPGNVLLGMDRPRLIDFGIARGTEDTSLTSTDLVIGSPGFLSPEQAQGRPAGPAADIFSLGCLLAYAATGEPPFGTGSVDALLYRTVHDEPVLGERLQEDPALTATLRACLAKHPDLRPTARDLDEELAEEAPGDGTDWLPDPVVATIAARAAELLALPAIEETLAEPGDQAAGVAGSPDGAADSPDGAADSPDGADGSPDGAGGSPDGPAGADTPAVAPAGAGPSRRRLLALASGAAVLAAGGGAAWLALRDRSDGGDGGDGKGAAGQGSPAATTPGAWTIGVHGDLTGARKDAGTAQERGVRLAVDAFNARTDKPFTLTVATADDAGRADRAAQAATGLIGNPDVLAVIGPTTDASVAPCLELYGEASLAFLTVSAAASVYGVGDRRSFFQTCPVTAAQADPLNLQFIHKQGARRLGILCDRDGDTDGWQTAYLANRTIATYVRQATAYARVVPRGDHDLTPVVADMLRAGIDSFFYTGTAQGAAQAAAALATAGFRGPRAADYALAGPEFVDRAGAAAEGWLFLAPYTGPDAAEVAEVARAHRAAYGAAPAVWTAEAYDVTRLVIERLVAASSGGRRPARADLLTALGQGTYRGLVKEYTFDDARRVKGITSFVHQVQGGRIQYAGPAPQRPVG
ncbi:bifunctional serine/threonine-protein kinase/ABC transporter substrate-binding protein [Streptomyces sp. NPDC090022]|uniref:bifunctional serine/threonine-protein kinase/ABC transporter substrate-binding protein n=1 Tax=Streptomyces sp. NPDC090022 TaxID=3365920 RepID=UPI00382D3E9F